MVLGLYKSDCSHKSVGKHFYIFSDFVKVRQLYGLGLIKVRLFLQIVWERTFYHFSNFGKVIKLAWVGAGKQ